ncbi:homeobox domain-containing protein [Paraclostridium dentum]|uniref:homeobox domain-containing protein n=1 Tax=Paraclostridium dentum TaxID=2662455 RepID=UPI003F2DB429
MGESGGFAVTETEDSNVLHVPLNAPVKSGTKGKVRAAFSERQMNALVQRFAVQRYLTPAEMRDLAEMIGLSYKQVRGFVEVARSYEQQNNLMHTFLNTWNLLCL